MDTIKQFGLELTPFQEQVVADLMQIQDRICAGLEEVDGTKFQQDVWHHKGGGGGRTRVIQGNVFEKGGVNFSVVTGPIPHMMQDRMKAGATQFFATGVSIVIHPVSPQVPIIHMNIRYFESDRGDQWIGGGIDLTPIYVNDAQAKQFHLTLKETCDAFSPLYYPSFKELADDYFFIKHRHETRGIGGIFYDYLKPDLHTSMETLWNFNTSVGNTFLKSYLPIVNANKELSFTEEQKQWQWVRRGRYVEFNLVWDKGTLFGLQTGGRIESILMSLPKFASWEYNKEVAEGTPEAHTQARLVKGIDWVNQA